MPGLIGIGEKATLRRSVNSAVDHKLLGRRWAGDRIRAIWRIGGCGQALQHPEVGAHLPRQQRRGCDGADEMPAVSVHAVRRNAARECPPQERTPKRGAGSHAVRQPTLDRENDVTRDHCGMEAQPLALPRGGENAVERGGRAAGRKIEAVAHLRSLHQ